MIVTAEGAIGSLFQEFWPDISRKLLHRDPTHGLDAQQATPATETPITATGLLKSGVPHLETCRPQLISASRPGILLAANVRRGV